LNEKMEDKVELKKLQRKGEAEVTIVPKQQI
jgi:hypothetical protein